MALNNFKRCWPLALMSLLCSAANSQVLFDQTNGCLANTSNALSSRLRRSTNVESADDFVVPEGKIWRPNRVVSQGSRSILDGLVNVKVYADNEDVFCLVGEPCPESIPGGDPLCSATGTAELTGDIIPIGVNEFAVNLPQNFCSLEEGRYWLSLTYVNNLCGIIAPCQDWYWDETRETSDTRDWVIRDIGNTSAEVTCSGFGLGSVCQSQPVQDNLCFDLEGESENERAPRADPELIAETVFVDDSLKLDLAPFITEPNGQPLAFSSPDLADVVALDSSGVILVEPGTNDATQDPVSTIRATDTSALSDDLLVALRIIDPNTIGLNGPFNSDVLMRCGVGKAGLEEGLDFSTPGNCGDAPASACEPMPEGALVINAQLEVQLEHPMVSDLGLRLQNPVGTEVVVMNRPNFSEFAITPSGGCEESDVHAVFSDSHTWSVEQQCTSPLAVAGDLEPLEQLATFRNQPGVGNTPWILQVDNAGNQDFEFTQWCLALQIEPNGAPIFPQAQLPGSATFVDLRTADEATLTGTLQGPDDVHWYLAIQNNGVPGDRSYQEVDTRITPAPGQILRSHRYSNEKFFGFNPSMAIGNCAISRELIYPRYFPTFGRDLIRVSGCGANAAGTYTLNIIRNVAGENMATIPFGVGMIVGLTRDIVSGEPVSRTFVTSGGTSAFAAPDGNFNAALVVGSQTVSIFHPDYLPLSFDAIIIQGETLDVGTLELTPTIYQAVTNQIIFETGFE